MFDFDTGKLVVIGIVALVVIGPKELPRVLRTVGQTVGKVRRMAGEFQSQFMEAMREAEMADVKEEMGKIAESAKIDVAFDPVRTIRDQISGAIHGETTPTPPLTELPEASNSVDLAQLETIAAPGSAPAEASVEGGLVGTGIAPVAEPVAIAQDGTAHDAMVPAGPSAGLAGTETPTSPVLP